MIQGLKDVRISMDLGLRFFWIWILVFFFRIGLDLYLGIGFLLDLGFQGLGCYGFSLDVGLRTYFGFGSLVVFFRIGLRSLLRYWISELLHWILKTGYWNFYLS